MWLITVTPHDCSWAISPEANVWNVSVPSVWLPADSWTTTHSPINNSWIHVLYSYLMYVSLHLYKNTEYSRFFTQNTNWAIITFDFLAPRLISCLEPLDSPTKVGLIGSLKPKSTVQVAGLLTLNNPHRNSIWGWSFSRLMHEIARFLASMHQTYGLFEALQRQENGKPRFCFVLFLFIHSLDLLQLMVSIDYV